jgi:hypothetical protein
MRIAEGMRCFTSFRSRLVFESARLFSDGGWPGCVGCVFSRNANPNSVIHKRMSNETASSQPQLYHHEPTLRVCTVFFSALIGFALTRFFRVDSPMPQVMRWPCFAAALLLFLRFLFGSANHLWYELVRPQETPTAKRGELYWHLSCLIVIGILAVYICDSTSVSQFLWRNLLFGIVGIVFNGLTDYFTGTIWVKEWMIVSGCHVVAVCLALYLNRSLSPFCGVVGAYILWVLAVFFLFLLFRDLGHQLSLVESGLSGKLPFADAPPPSQHD